MSADVWGGWDAAVRDDPFPTFAAARSRCPVQAVRLPDGHEAWVVLGYDTARRALGDDRLSKNMVEALARDPEVVSEGLPGPGYARHMLAMDDPDHGRLRGQVAAGFRPSRVASMRPTVEALADRLLDDLADAGPDAVVDLRAGYAHPLPFAVICELLGVDEDHRDLLHDAFETLLRPWPTPPPPEAVAASDTVTTAIRDLLDRARPDPEGDVVSVLVDAVDRGVISPTEARSSLFQLVVAGHDTTSSLLGNAVVALLDHPDQLATLVGSPDLLSTAVEELMRFTAPVPHATFRVTTEAIDLDGVTVPAGQQVLVGLGAANRDPALVEDPDRLDVSRRSRHLAFGHGAHHCLGAPLARLEADVALRRLLGRFPGLRLAVPRDRLAWSHGDGLVLRGLASLPVVLGPDHGASARVRSRHNAPPTTAATPASSGSDDPPVSARRSAEGAGGVVDVVADRSSSAASGAAVVAAGQCRHPPARNTEQERPRSTGTTQFAHDPLLIEQAGRSR